MKRFTILLVVMTVAFLGNMASGQEAAGIPDDIIKELDAFEGTWTLEGKIGDKVQTGTSRIRWVRTEEGKKICLFARATFRMDGKTQNVATILGWNAATKCIEDHGFVAEGDSGVNTWTVTSPGKWRGVLRMVVNGKEVTTKGNLIVKGTTEIVTDSESETGEVAATYVFRKVEKEDKATDKQ